jgi:hypothetical protein
MKDVSNMSIKKDGEINYWLASLEFWREALGMCSRDKILAESWQHKSMWHLNHSRRLLALAIRNTERKLNRPHRHLPRLGCVQYMGNGK